MMNSTMFTLGLVLVLHLTSSCAILDQQVPEETDSYNGMEEKGEGPWSKWNRLRGVSKRPWRPFRPEEKPYVTIHEFPDNDINNFEKKINMFRASKRINFRQGCIFRLTCSYPELTEDHVLILKCVC